MTGGRLWRDESVSGDKLLKGILAEETKTMINKAL